MGRGSYTARDWEKLKTSRSITSDARADNLFKNRQMLDKFNPKFIGMREARDNDEHPNSTPIAIGVDVTGSMGYLSEEIVKNSLNELMKKAKTVEDMIKVAADDALAQVDKEYDAKMGAYANMGLF